MKKTISFILCLLLLVGCTLCVSADKSTVILSASSNCIAVCETAVYTLSLKGFKDVTGGSVDVELEDGLTTVSGRFLKDGSKLEIFDIDNNKGTVAFENALDLNGAFFEIVVRATKASSAKKNIRINVKLSDGTGGSCKRSIKVHDANIMVTPYENSAEIGNTLTYIVGLKNCNDTTGGSVQIRTDENTELVSGEFLKDGEVLEKFDLKKRIGAIAYNEPTDLNGDFFKLTVKIKSYAKENNFVVINIELSDGSLMTCSCDIMVAAKKGDINRDGEIDVLDLIVLKKCIAKNSDDFVSSADINSDGAVNGTDLVMLKKMLIGINS